MNKRKAKKLIRELDTAIAELQSVRYSLDLIVHPMIPAEELLSRLKKGKLLPK